MPRPRLPQGPAPDPTRGPEGSAAPGVLPPSAATDQPFGGSRVLQGDSDEALAERSSRGDDRAFETLVDRYERVVFTLTLRMTGNRDDAREMTQDVFVKVWRGLRGFDPERRFFSWIYRIAIHECLNLRRRSGRHEALEGEPESNEAGPEQRFEAAEVERQMQKALAGLPAADRLIIILRHFLDYAHEEIAEILRVPAKTVKSRLYSARQRLRVELEQRGVRR